MTLSDFEIAENLWGGSPGSDDYREALAELRDDGYALVHRDTLAAMATAGTNDHTTARRLAVIALLSSDLDLLAEAVVTVMWDDCHSLEAERAA